MKMNQTIRKKAGSLLLALAIILSAALSYAQPVMASGGETVKLYKSEQKENAVAATESKLQFEVKGKGTVSFSLTVDHVSNLTAALYDKEGKPVSGISNPYPVSADSFKENADHKFIYTDSWNLTEGTYTCGLTFAEDTIFTAEIFRTLPTASISKTRIGITAGSSQKLSVSGAKVKSWISKKKTIAVVDAKGVVTGKKHGKTVITAKLEDGRELSCNVTVYKNVYTDAKGTIDRVKPGKVEPQPYYAGYDSKGNLRIKVNILNTTEKNVIALTKLKIKVKDKNKKTTAFLRLNKRKLSVPSCTAKTVTFIIPKSQITKQADLRKSKVYVIGHYQAERAR